MHVIACAVPRYLMRSSAMSFDMTCNRDLTTSIGYVTIVAPNLANAPSMNTSPALNADPTGLFPRLSVQDALVSYNAYCNAGLLTMTSDGANPCQNPATPPSWYTSRAMSKNPSDFFVADDARE